MTTDESITIILIKAKSLQGYRLESLDGELGRVKQFYYDDRHWTIRCVIVDRRNWWPGNKVPISPKWIERVSWNESRVYVNLLRELIKNSPQYTEDSLLTRDYETGLHRHYNPRDTGLMNRLA